MENPLLTQGYERVAIEAVARSDPDVWIEAVAAQDAHAFADPCPLYSGGDACKLRNAMQIDQAAAAAYAQVMVAVETDRSSCGFQSTHAIPEGWIGRRNF